MYVSWSFVYINNSLTLNQLTKNEPKERKQGGQMTQKTNDPKRVPPRRLTERLK